MSEDTGRRCPRCDCPDGHEQCDHCKVCPHATSVRLCPKVHRVPHDAHDHCPGWAPDEEGHPEPPSDEELNAVLPVLPDPRQGAYDAVYKYIRRLGAYLPPDPVHRNAVIWRAVHAALGATPVGRCVSSHCVEGGHILPVEGEAP